MHVTKKESFALQSREEASITLLSFSGKVGISLKSSINSVSFALNFLSLIQAKDPLTSQMEHLKP